MFLRLLKKRDPMPEIGPIRDRIDTIAARGGVSFEQAQARHETHLKRVNTALRQMGAGQLIAVPLSPSACQPGKIAEFLMLIQADPFLRWNMAYFASDAATAETLDTETYRPGMENDWDVAVTDVIGRVSLAWDGFKSRYPEASEEEIIAFREILRKMLSGLSTELEPKLYPGRANKWKAFFGEAITTAA